MKCDNVNEPAAVDAKHKLDYCEAHMKSVEIMLISGGKGEGVTSRMSLENLIAT